MLQKKIKTLYAQVKNLENSPEKESRRMPSECFFLADGAILCYPREIGDGRYPYQKDGRTLWAYSSGNMEVGESLYNIFLNSTEGKEPYIAFFAGAKCENGKYFPLSITGVARQPMEYGVNRFTVYTPEAVYYFTETEELLSAVRAFVDEDKRICFSVYAENKTDKPLDTYLAAYFNPLLRHQDMDDFEDKWYKACTATEYGYCFRVTEHINRDNCMLHYAAVKAEGRINPSVTTSRYDVTGSTASCLNCSKGLQEGKYAKEKPHTEFTDVAVASDISKITLAAGENHAVHYVIAVADDKAKAEALAQKDCNVAKALDDILARAEEEGENDPIKKLDVKFEGFTGVLEGKEIPVNGFFYNVMKQVDFCARAKNYAGPYIGVRDVTQQVEAAIVWDSAYVRKKLIEVLSFTGDEGRAPRQYSYPASSKVPPKMDLRAYIDQGIWLIDAVYTYLAYTGDYSILDEVCGYYNFDGFSMKDRTGQTVKFSSRRDSVLEHLIAIADYLCSNLDEKTDCLHALYGDWNDALDGLGRTEKEGADFGTGVSVMASEQLFRNLTAMIDILEHKGGNGDKIAEYKAARERLKNGLIKNAIVSNGKERKILHGWGDEYSWFVGSYCDNDGYSRDSITVNAYWILAGLHKEYGEIVPEILNAYKRLEGKYGIKTFLPAFAPTNDKVGRITHLPEGTAENGATYNHSTNFAIWSLFELGEDELAWETMYKVLPVTHSFITTTPFVMPNSFIYNEERGFDGESMNDWFSGSGSVLIKLLFGGIFGVRPNLDGVEIRPSSYMPCEKASITLNVKGAKVNIVCKKAEGERKYLVNGKEYKVENGKGVTLTNAELSGNILIEILN